MSILIKNMKIPRAGSCITVRIWDDGRVVGVHQDSNVWEAVTIPSHGRLIDADAFKEYIHVSFDQVAPELEGGYKWLAEQITKDLLNDIDDAPTIIEEEMEA